MLANNIDIHAELEKIVKKISHTNELLKAVNNNIELNSKRLEGAKTLIEDERRERLVMRFERDALVLRDQKRQLEEKLDHLENARWWAKRTIMALELKANSLQDGTLKHNPFQRLAG